MFLRSRSRLRTAAIAAVVGAGVLTAATPAAAAPPFKGPYLKVKAAWKQLK